MIAKRWQVSEDGVSWIREVFPENAGKVRLTDSRDLDAGQIFFRRKINTALIFSDKNGARDFTYFRSFETRRNARCRTLYIRVQMQCSSAWETLWTGKLSAGSGTWDLQNCLFEVEPEPMDRFTCLLEKIGIQKNILTSPAYMTMIHSGPGLEFYSCSYDPDLEDECDAPSGTGWTYMDAYVIDTVPVRLARTWVRKRAVTLCSSLGVPVPPEPSGWTLDTNSCSTDGTATYVKGLSAGEVGEIVVNVQTSDLIEGGCVSGASAPPPQIDPDIPTAWIELFDCADPIHPSRWLALSIEDIDRSVIGPGASRTGRRLRDVIDLLVADCPGITAVRSDFLEIDPVGDADGYAPGVNYVTGLANTMSNVMICQKSDLIDLGVSNTATRGMMSGTDLFKALRIMPRLLYDFDANGVLRIEHYSYWAAEEGLDLADMENVNESLVYDHRSADTPMGERVKFMEAFGVDFIGADLLYDAQCAKGPIDEVSPGKITTDVGLILKDPTAVSKDGFVFLSCDYASGIYSTVVGLGVLSNKYVWNAPFSTANLQDAFWRHDRYLPTGTMNDEAAEFDGFIGTIEQKNVRASLCCQLLSFNPRKTLGTALGEQYLGGLRATVVEVEHDLDLCRSTFSLTYPY